MSGLVLERVAFAFGASPVLEGIELRVAPGEVVGVTGPNGAGKSTLLRIAAGLLIPGAGRVRANGRSPLAAARLGEIAWCGSGDAWTRRLTLGQGLAFHARLLGLPPPEARRRIEAAAEAVGLARLDERADRCSTGQRQRAALARVLLGGPRVALLDEPLRGVDAGSVLPVASSVREHLRDAAVLWVSHDADELARVATRSVALADGRVAPRRLARVA